MNDQPAACKFCHSQTVSYELSLWLVGSKTSASAVFACHTTWDMDQQGYELWHQSDECYNRVVNAKEKR